jgi:serine/threonine protein kinase/formylglycine-generating enzyme required for sulfatase activity/tetratricopeptide (TPR) repeat protein
MSERTIFLTALDKDNPSERSAYLDSACAGEPALRQRVEALLKSHDDAGSFLDAPIGEQMNAAAGQTEVADPSIAAQAQKQTETQAEPVGRVSNPSHQELEFLAPSEKPGSLGRLDHYEVLEIMGRGGMGVVLKAFDEVLHRVVAVKVLAPQLATNATARKRFVREAQAGAAVCHDHVVTIHGVDEGKAVPYLVMQCVAGLSLQDKLDRDGPLSLQAILRIGMQTAEGLAAAHKQGLVHRDIKPANILLENGIERVKITDFGLARAVDDASITQSGHVAGTPQYMSPEQAHGEAVDHRSDLFSLGSVLYAMCTGRPPFRATGSMAVLKRVCEDTPRPIREVNPEIPEWLCAIIAKLHAKNRAERFQSATEVADLLRQHLAHLQQPTLVPLPTPVVQATAGKQRVDQDAPATKQFEPGKRKRTQWALGIMEVVGISAVAGITSILASPLDQGFRVALSGLILAWTAVAGLFLFMPARRRRVATFIWVLAFLLLGTGATMWLLYSDPRWWKDLWTQGGQIEDIPENHTFLTINCNDPELHVVIEGEGNTYSGGLANGLTMYLKPGTHTLRLKKGNQIVYEEKFSIAPGENHVVDLTGGVCQPLPAKAPFTSDEAKKHQAAWAKYLGVPVEIENSIGMKLRLIPLGEFSMGIPDKEKEKVLQLLSEDWQKGLVREELSSQPMRIRSAFYLGETELTVGQFKQFITATGYKTTAESDELGGRAVVKGTIERRPEWTWKHPADAESDDHPVVQISFADAQAFCRWLSGVDGRQYYVPNEQEWEFACRAGTETHWYCGNDLEQLDGIAWTLLNAGGKTHPVGKKAPNAFGLYDMLGNAEEVCVSDTGMPAARGGHTSLPLLCRCSSRVPVPFKETYYRRGVRIAAQTSLIPNVVPAPAAGVRLNGEPLIPHEFAEEQVSQVDAELKKLNAGFEGCASHGINYGVVTQFDLVTDQVTDISPMRALTGLKQMNINGSAPGKSKLTDLSPLRGLPLKEIVCDFEPSRDAVVLRSIKTLTKINGKPAGEFWMTVDGPTVKAADCLVRAWEFARADKWTQAEAEFFKAADAKPDDPQVFRWRAFIKAEGKLFEQAAAEFNKALELAPRNARIWKGDRAGIDDTICQWEEVFNRVAKLRPNDANLWIARARWFAHRGRWISAADASEEVFSRDPNDAENWFMDAPLRLQIGDVDGYRRDCKELLQRFGATEIPRTADYVAKTCALLPDAVDDLKPVMKLAKILDESRLVGSDKEQLAPWLKLCRALADYRKGEFAPAVQQLRTLIQSEPTQSSLEATAHAVFAMAAHRAGYQGADDERQKARDLVNNNMPRPGRGERFGDDWHDWLRCRILLREAETLIEGKPRSEK